MGQILDISEALLVLGLSGSVSEEERGIVQESIRGAEGSIKRFLRYDPTQRTRTEYYPQSDFARGSREVVWEVEGTTAVQRRLSEASTDELQLKHIPIRSISDLRIDYDGRHGQASGAFGSDSQKTEGVDFWASYDGWDSADADMCRDGILRSFGLWPITPGSVRVTYTAGYTEDELRGEDTVVDASPIWEAILDETVRRVRKRYASMKTTRGFLAGVIQSENLGDYSYSLGGGGGSGSEKLFGSDMSTETREKLTDFVNVGVSFA
jgi:hypothetical protein